MAILRNSEVRLVAYVYNLRNESTFAYDDFGSLTNETVVGVAGTNTIIRHWDSFGRSLGYSLVGRDDPIAPHEEFSPQYDLDGY